MIWDIQHDLQTTFIEPNGQLAKFRDYAIVKEYVDYEFGRVRLSFKDGLFYKRDTLFKETVSLIGYQHSTYDELSFQKTSHTPSIYRSYSCYF